MTSRSLGHRAPLLWLVLPMIAGLVLARVLELPSLAWLLAGAALTALLALAADARNAPAALPLLCLSMAQAGAASYAIHRPVIAAWYTLPPREARFSLEIDRVFPQIEPWRATGLATILRAEEPLQEVIGQRVYFSLNVRQGAPPVRSAVLSGIGVLAALPRNPPTNSFDAYLANAGINFRFTRGRVTGEERRPTAYRRFCATQAERFAAVLGAGIDTKRPELVSVYRAMLLGQQHELNDAQETVYRRSGTMHVFSISGLHIAAIAGALYALLALFRLPRPMRFAVGCVALWLYVDITGGAPSAVRAFAMVTLVQASLVLQVPRNPLAALAASALVVTLVAPLQVFSASFQLSYGIVAALLLLGLPMADRWHSACMPFGDLPRPAWRWYHHAWTTLTRATLTAVAIGMSASLVSAVTGIMFFGLFTPGALVANLWVIPAATAVIFAGFVSLVCGLVGFAAGSVLANHAAALLLWLVDAGVKLFAAIPGAWSHATFRPPWLGGWVLVVLLGALLLGYAQRWSGWQRGYWVPFAIVAAALVVGVKFAAPVG